MADAAFFAYSWKLPAYNGAFLLTIDNFSLFIYSWSSVAYSFSFFTYSWSFFAYSGKVRLIRALRDCKQRSLTVSKKAPTVSKKLLPFMARDSQRESGPEGPKIEKIQDFAPGLKLSSDQSQIEIFNRDWTFQ